MEIRANATRMELLRLKKRLNLARRGHKLLKDKLDELIRRFLELVHDYRQLRQQMEQAIASAMQGLVLARTLMSPEEIEETLIVPPGGVSLESSRRSIMNIQVPQFELKMERQLFGYGLASTSADLDTAFSLFAQALPMMIKLAEKEKTIQLLAGEIERTRRRVNALEYVFIPNIEATLRRISMRLGELERSNLVLLMRVKEIVRQH